jgi:DNA-3-methyladenine glycosylase
MPARSSRIPANSGAPRALARTRAHHGDDSRSSVSSRAAAGAWRERFLPRDFYRRPVLTVARELIGAVLVHDGPDGFAAGRIVETEAYRAPADLASHASGGRRTARNEAMWGEAGHAYMFLLYGMHWAFNVVTGAPGEPHAVLVRALEPLEPFEAMCARRRLEAGRRELTSGPGRLCAALGLDRRHYGVDLCGGGPLYLARGLEGRLRVGRSARINVDYAGAWAARPWRFYLRGNRFVSVPPRD